MELRGFGLIPFDYDHDGDRDLLLSRMGSLVVTWPNGKVTTRGPFIADRYMTIVE